MYTTAHPRVLKALRQAGFNCQQRQDILDTANQNGAEKFSHQQALSWAGVTEATLIEQCASLHELLDELETQVKNGESPDFNAALEPTVVSFEGMETAQRWLQPLQIHPVDLKAMDHVFGMLRNRYPQLLRSDLPGAANISPEAINLGRWWVVPFAVLFSLMLYAGASIVAGHFLSGWVLLVGAGLVLMVSLTAAFNVAGAKPLSQTYLSGIHGVSMALLGATLLVPAVVYKGFVLPSTSAQYQKQVLPVAVDASSPWLMNQIPGC